MNQGQPVPFCGIARLWRDRQTWLAKSKLTYMSNNKESISDCVADSLRYGPFSLAVDGSRVQTVLNV